MQGMQINIIEFMQSDWMLNFYLLIFLNKIFTKFNRIQF